MMTIRTAYLYIDKKYYATTDFALIRKVFMHHTRERIILESLLMLEARARLCILILSDDM